MRAPIRRDITRNTKDRKESSKTEGQKASTHNTILYKTKTPHIKIIFFYKTTKTLSAHPPLPQKPARGKNPKSKDPHPSNNELLRTTDMRFAPHPREPQRKNRTRQMVGPAEVPPPKYPIQRHNATRMVHWDTQRLQRQKSRRENYNRSLQIKPRRKHARTNSRVHARDCPIGNRTQSHISKMGVRLSTRTLRLRKDRP